MLAIGWPACKEQLLQRSIGTGKIFLMLSRAPQIAWHLEQIAAWVPGLQSRGPERAAIRERNKGSKALQAGEGDLQDHREVARPQCPVVGSRVSLGEPRSKSNG